MPGERVQAWENLAALMAPEDQPSAHLQRYVGLLSYAGCAALSTLLGRSGGGYGKKKI
jgi:hypothetical protein